MMRANAPVENGCPICYRARMTENQNQLDKFKEAAREHGADESEAHWDERLKRIVKAKPAPVKPA